MTPVGGQLGIRPNLAPFLWLVVNVLLVGATVGMERTVVPLLGHYVYRIGPTLALSFIATFGLAKAPLNLVAGRLSDRVGRRPLLIVGWALGIPMILLLLLVHAWWAILVANVLLGANQGLTWTMTVTSQLDLVGAGQRGLAMGINEATGYVGVALATVATGAIGAGYGITTAPFVLGAAVIAVGLATILACVPETQPFVHLERSDVADQERPSLRRIFVDTSFRHPQLSIITWGGFANKLADTVAWGALPLFFAQAGLSLKTISVLSGIYAFSWGVSQYGTGLLSDRVGRKRPVVIGTGLLGAALTLLTEVHGFGPWALLSALAGIGMALLYPNLNAAVADVAKPTERGSVLGVYRLWRDGGYAVGGLGIGALMAAVGVGGAVLSIGLVVLATAFLMYVRMKETHAAPPHKMVPRPAR